MELKKAGKMMFGMVFVCFLLGIDQLTKYLSIGFLKDSSGIVLIPGVFELQYVENFGAAFGILQKQRIFLLVFSLLVLFFLFLLYFRVPSGKRFYPMKFVLLFLASGAVGNMIDRFFRGFVVDFFYFKLIHFPVFNVADCYVVCSVIVAFFLICFYYKEEELNFFRKKGDTEE